jgi:hypothetical protein
MCNCLVLLCCHVLLSLLCGRLWGLGLETEISEVNYVRNLFIESDESSEGVSIKCEPHGSGRRVVNIQRTSYCFENELQLVRLIE